MAGNVTNLKPLTEDHERYKDVYYNAFYKIAQKDVVLERVTNYFDANLKKMITDVYDSNEEFRLLAVGVGEGPHEFHFLKSLQPHYPSLSIVTVDPNEHMLAAFKDKVTTLTPEVHGSPVVCDSFAGPLDQFVTESPLARGKYNLISAIHALYYTGDFETTFNQMAVMLEDRGIMVIVCKTSSLNTKTFHRLTWLTKSTNSNERLSSTDVRAFAESRGYDVTTVEINLDWDITAVFDERSEFGDKLLDFFTQAAYFRKTAPTELLDDLISFWRSISVVDADGRIRAPARDEMLIVSKRR